LVGKILVIFLFITIIIKKEINKEKEKNSKTSLY